MSESEAKWYVAHTYSGYENKVKANIEKTIENRHLEEQILEVLVPIEEVVEMTKVKARKKTEEFAEDISDPLDLNAEPAETELKASEYKSKTIKRKVFPGYVFLNMVMNDDTWYVVRNTRGVTGFVGPGSKPVPLTESQIQDIRFYKSQSEFKVGEQVIITDPAWEDKVGVITGFDTKKHTVNINVELFGRETPVEISYNAIKKL